MLLRVISLATVQDLEMSDPAVGFDAVGVGGEGEHDGGFAAQTAGSEFAALS